MQTPVEATDEQQARLERIRRRCLDSEEPCEEWEQRIFTLAEIALQECLKNAQLVPQDGHGYVLYLDEIGHVLALVPVAVLASWRGCSKQEYEAEMTEKFSGVAVRVIAAVGAYGKSWTIEMIRVRKGLLN
jgi:hypothetical protein